MKFSMVCVAFLAVFAISKADPVTSPYVEAQIKALMEIFDQASKKFEEMSGLKTQFDKDKSSNMIKTFIANCSEQFNQFVEKWPKDSKVVPEELKKKYEEAVKQVQEVIKGLNSPEVQERTKKMHETIINSFKKTCEATVDLSKSLGLAVPSSMQKPWMEMVEELQKSAKTLQEKSQKMLEGLQEELKKKKAN